MKSSKNKKKVVNSFVDKVCKSQKIKPLPATVAEINELGWDYVDIILVTGDAYIDHPSFGVALIGRWLADYGYRVAILAQPNWHNAEDFKQFGPPRLFWGITGGSVDSRLNNYSSMGHRRGEDSFSPGGKIGLRPDKPLPAYAARAREAYKGVPIILGGLEASLRRLVHYDYIEDKIKRSIIIDAKADMLVFGMGEIQILEIANRLSQGAAIEDITDIPGTAYPVTRGRTVPDNALEIPSAKDQDHNRSMVIQAHKIYHQQANPNGCPVVQEQNPGKVLINPPAPPLSTEQMDRLYSLEFTRKWHPMYDKMGGVPALEPIQFSITSHRGCFGGCNFCSLYYHQGKTISSRSIESILNEADKILMHPDFKGTISDVGGPSANMYGMKCAKDTPCQRASCLFPNICKNLIADQLPAIKLLERIIQWQSQQKRKTNVFIASGIRHDLILYSTKKYPNNSRYAELLIGHFTGGHLKLAPEHIDPEVLKYMGKPDFNLFEEFEIIFNHISDKYGKQQFIVPYFISAHPGSTIEHAQRLYEYLAKRNWKLRQVQDFTPVPLTQSTAVFISGVGPDGNKVYSPKGRQEKKTQMALLKFHQQQNQQIIKKRTQFKKTNKRPKHK